MIECELTRIVIRDNTNEQYIYLKERDGNRSFPILIGPSEAEEIQRKSTRRTTDRPLTHDLLRSTLKTLGGCLQSIEVHALHDHTFYANLVVEQGGKILRIDSRPSDAIALAVAEGVPVVVAEEVIEEASQGSGGGP